MTINMISQLIYRVSPKKKRIQGTGSCVFFCFFLWGFSKSNTLRTRDEATSDRRVSCFPAGVVRYHQRPGAGSAETKRKGEEKEEKRREEKRKEGNKKQTLLARYWAPRSEAMRHRLVAPSEANERNHRHYRVLPSFLSLFLLEISLSIDDSGSDFCSSSLSNLWIHPRFDVLIPWIDFISLD